jgi:hypothetical protein
MDHLKEFLLFLIEQEIFKSWKNAKWIKTTQVQVLLGLLLGLHPSAGHVNYCTFFKVCHPKICESPKFDRLARQPY